jgi:hypothetical protein
MQSFLTLNLTGVQVLERIIRVERKCFRYKSIGIYVFDAAKLEKIKTENNPAQLYKWAAIDNRYFLAAFIPSNALNFLM